MKYSFHLRSPKSKNETLILFTCHFNDEKKKFVFSTQKSILPKHWDFKNKCPNKTGRNISRNLGKIKRRLRQFEDEFDIITTNSELGQKSFDSTHLKEHFDKIFERVAVSSSFFDIYDQFMEEKIKLKEWKKGTIKRYNNIKNLLLEFEDVYNYKLTFGKINKKFFMEFTDFCYEYKNHYINTFSRNIGLFKTFMFWSHKNEHVYNTAFQNFKKPQRVLTREEILTFDQLKVLARFRCKSQRLEEVKDVFLFQCHTGMRYGELKLVNKRIITESDCILLKEEKDAKKPPRLIPLSDISKAILMKYDYQLPLISNQKQNDAIKEVMRDIGFISEVEFSKTKGVEQETFIKGFHERISTHTARRSFITLMRNEGIPDKTIMSITGHTDIKSFNVYHQVDNSARINAVHKVFLNF